MAYNVYSSYRLFLTYRVNNLPSSNISPKLDNMSVLNSIFKCKLVNPEVELVFSEIYGAYEAHEMLRSASAYFVYFVSCFKVSFYDLP